MSGHLRRQVLSTFKKLHRTRLNTFRDDDHALHVTRSRINDEYRKSKNVTDEKVIAELDKLAKEVEREIRCTVVQAREVEPGKFAVHLTPDTELVDNAVIDASACSQSARKKPSNFKKCSDSTKTS